MMLSTLKKELHTLDTNADRLRQFGVLVGVILLGIEAYFWWAGSGPVWLGAAGALLVIFGMFLPKLLYWPYMGWMGIAFVLGAMVSRILLTIIFYLIVTPIGIMLRLIVGSPLEMSTRNMTSYWEEYETPDDYKESFKHPF